MNKDTKEIVKWAKENAEISHDDDDLIVGKHNGKPFRIFPTEDDGEGWAGVRQGNSWEKSTACYTLDGFKEALKKE